MPASEQQLARLTFQQQELLLRSREQVATLVDRSWQTVQPISDAQLKVWLEQAVPMLDAAKTVAASTTTAYVSTYVGLATGTTPVIDVDAATVAAEVRGGVSTAAVLTRPVVAARIALSQGGSTHVALSIGRARAAQYARTDPQLAFRDAFRAAAEQTEHVVGYRRVPRGSACKFCLRASTQRYHVRDLMPCHPGCGCTVSPIVGTEDPGYVIDRPLLDRLKAGEGDYVVHEHGELGPVLVGQGVEFKSEHDF